jgi:site-specific recombinase XerD
MAEDFTSWLNAQNYTAGSIAIILRGQIPLVRWWRRRRINALSQVTVDELAAAYAHFLHRRRAVSPTIPLLRTFLVERQIICLPRPEAASVSDVQRERYAKYLRQVRGLNESTVMSHLGKLRVFLSFLRLDNHPQAIATLRHEVIENFLRQSALTNNRHSLHHVVSILRSFLRWQYSQGNLSRPLHLHIDAPRIYQMEQLPQTLPWDQVQELLRSIDRSKPVGMRDFTMLYLVAAYGLRAGEVARLRLDDIDWRKATLRVLQTKNGRTLQLPLTDQAGDVLQRYLYKGRPRTERRELFMRSRAPIKPLHPASVSVIRRWIDKNGLQIRSVGIHALRHAFAVHLLRQGVSTKAIGDTMGHGDIRSTAVYLRLAVEDLRTVGLPAPETISTSVRLKSLTHYCIPCNGYGKKRRPLPVRFRSGFKASLERYLAIKHAVGVNYENERAILFKWDAWFHQSQNKSITVTRESFQHWVETLTGLTPTNRRNRMRGVRNFLLFHARDNPVEFIPDVATFPKATSTKPPRLVSESEMARVLAVARQLTPGIGNPVRAQTIRIALVLSFCCGLRRGELLRLRVSHLDTKQQLLRIEKTKFHKSRLVPLPESVAKELQDYMEQRRRFRLPLESNSFLIGSGLHSDSQSAYTPCRLNQVWRQLCAAAGVSDKNGRPPRLHDLRHSFAVNALSRWYAERENVQVKLPYLATYLGHADINCTHYYLHLTPQLREAASQCFRTPFAHLLEKEGQI